MKSEGQHIVLLARDLAPQLIELRRFFHQHPELSREEHLTTQKIKDALADLGIEIADLNLETGVCGRISSGEGRIVALRADIDALPLQEKTGLPFASRTEGCMHACGHDSHITWLLGAAMILTQMKEKFTGEVRLIFQPAEERTNGAQDMIAAGALEGVDMIFGAHNKPDLPADTVGIAPGYLMASVAGFKITVTGRGGHGAIPHLTRDPMPVAGAILTGLQSIVARNVDPLESAVISVGSITGGTAGNIIPGEVTITGTVRAYTPEVQALITRRLQTLASATAMAFDCTAECTGPTFRLPPVDNDPEATRIARTSTEKILGSDRVVDAVPVLASEDFSLYQERTPGCFMWIGSDSPDKGWHHPEFTVNEDCLPVGAAVLAAAALEALRELNSGS